jgi:2-amino-4-hydroxy-6-hydroxymethyldihydropteridine diphosphokinase
LLAAGDQIDVFAQSSVYETEPVGEVLEQRDFYNAVIAIQTDLTPHQLLAACKNIERELGRVVGGPRHGPRVIDVDLLLIDDIVLSDDRLTIPHPELANRRFVLVPLQEVAPELTLADGRTLGEAMAALGEGQRVERVASLHI